MTALNRAEQSRGHLLRDGVLTVAAVLLALAAFDDITTDSDLSFTFEWLGLGVCAAWLLVVSWRLIRGENRWLGSVSAGVLVVAVAAATAIRPGTDPFRIEYLLTMAALAWFLALGAILASRSFVARRGARRS